jgi:hypothetical protein
LIPDIEAVIAQPEFGKWCYNGEPTVILIESSVVEGLDVLRSHSIESDISRNAKLALKALRKVRELGNTSEGVCVSNTVTLREVTYKESFLEKSVLSSALEAAQVLKSYEERTSLGTRLIELAQRVSFSRLKAVVYLVTPSVSLQKKAQDQCIKVLDPEDLFESKSTQQERQISEVTLLNEHKGDLPSSPRRSALSFLGEENVNKLENVLSRTLESMALAAHELKKNEKVMQHVMDTAYEALPFPVRLLITKEQFETHVRSYIDKCFAVEREGRSTEMY